MSNKDKNILSKMHLGPPLTIVKQSIIIGMTALALTSQSTISLAQSQLQENWTTDLEAAADALYYSPDSMVTDQSGTYFGGFYGGVEAGLFNNNHKTFFTTKDTYRVPAALFAGYNHYVGNGIHIGAEVSVGGNYEPVSGTFGTSAMAMARVGIETSKDFLFYETVGIGLLDGRPAYAWGYGGEQAITDSFSVRLQAVSYGQLSATPPTLNYGGFTAMKFDVGAIWHLDGPERQANVRHDRTTESVTEFDGFYAGAYSGIANNWLFNYFGGSNATGWHFTRGVHGLVGGYNLSLNDWFRVGAELQGGFNNNTSGGGGWDVQALARIGVVPLDGFMVYGDAGVGILENRNSYVYGGGVEYALWGNNTFRLDTQFMGEITPAGPILVPTGWTAIKVTGGILFHFD